jgi:hypothetical protein
MFLGNAFLVFGIGALFVLICRLAVHVLPVFVTSLSACGPTGPVQARSGR